MITSSTITTPPARYWTLYRVAIALLLIAAVTSVTAYYAGDQIAAAITGKPIIIGRNVGFMPPGAGLLGRPGAHLALEQFDQTDLLLDRQRIIAGGPRKDGIPALTDPAKVPLSKADFMADNYRVVGLTINGQSRAYPINLLNQHECVNDNLGGVSIAVIYCPLCDSVSVVDRRVDGKTLEFGISGLLYNSNVLLYDRTDQALWSQVKLTAISGPNSGKSLKHLTGWQLTDFGDWKQTHPDSTVVSLTTGHRRNYHANPYAGYFTTDAMMFPAAPIEKRMAPKTTVIGIRVADQVRAYPTQTIAAAPNVILHDQLGGAEIELRADIATGRIEVVRAPDEAGVVHTFCFAWVAFHPQTQIYGQTIATQPASK